MKQTRIVEKKYKGYVIKPTLTGFKVYHKGYFIQEYPTLKTVYEHIDNLITKHEQFIKKGKDKTTSKKSKQLSLFWGN